MRNLILAIIICVCCVIAFGQSTLEGKKRKRTRKRAKTTAPLPEKTDESETPKPPLPTPKPQKPPVEKGTPPPGPTKLHVPAEYETLYQLWNNARSFIELEDFDRAIGLLDNLRREALRLGIPNLFRMSVALLRSSRQLVEKNRPKEALRLCLAAQRLAPDLPVAHFIAASVYWSESKLNVGKMISEYVRGAIKTWRHLPSRISTGANMLALLWVAMLIALVLTCSIGVSRAVPLLAQDISRWIGGHLPSLQIRILLFAFLLAPLLVGAGLLITVLIWSVFIGLYARRANMAVPVAATMLVFAAVLLNPLFLRGARFTSTPLYSLYRCNFGLCEDPDRDVLATMSDDPDAQLTRAQITLRQKKYPEAERALRELIKRGNPSAEVYNNLGVVLELQGKTKEGLDAYNLALKQSPRFVAALYNKALALYQRGDNAAGKRFLLQAEDVDSDWVARYRKLQDFLEKQQTGGKVVVHRVHVPVSQGRIEARLRHLTLGDEDIALPFAGLLIGTMRRSDLLWSSALTLLVMVLLIAIRRYLFLATGCTRCNRPADRLEPHNLPKGEGEVSKPSTLLCKRCADLRDGAHTAKETWIREKRVEGRKVLKEKLASYAGFAVPGLSQLLSGRLARGLVYSGLFVVAILNILGWRGVLRELFVIDTSVPLARLITSLVVAFVIYLVALFDGLSKTREVKR
ncbi:MAG: tetratricopeptide repeat protein [Myxococcales bacterium]|nr:tetratricopeptide repeat protein [Myxococcales bacterium]